MFEGPQARRTGVFYVRCTQHVRFRLGKQGRTLLVLDDARSVGGFWSF